MFIATGIFILSNDSKLNTLNWFEINYTAIESSSWSNAVTDCNGLQIFIVATLYRKHRESLRFFSAVEG